MVLIYAFHFFLFVFTVPSNFFTDYKERENGMF
jgi:hypothetical protein